VAEINSMQKLKKYFPRQLFFVPVIILFTFLLQSQDIPGKKTGKKRVDIINTDTLFIVRDRQTGKDWYRLVTNVILKHNEIILKCDSAHYFPDKIQVNAFSRIKIEQGDTLDILGDYLLYDGITETAVITGKVELIDKETHLFTNSVNYDVKNEIAQYPDSGRIINGDNKLTSKIGTYYVSQNLFHFKDSVKIVNPDYIMTADTMDYNTVTETAFFTGPSEMKGDSIYLYCERGWYDTKNNTTRIWKNAVIDNRQQIIHGDSLFYDDNNGYGQSFNNVSIADTNNHIIVKGNYAWYYKTPERFQVTDSAMFIQISDKDSLFLHADTINAFTMTDTAGLSYRLLRAYYGCRIFSKDLQAKCDSLAYSFQDSVIRLYVQPVLWSEENQLTADSMAIFTRNRQADRMELYNSAFVCSQVDEMRFNQIKGRSLTGFFRDNKLFKIDISGNGESIYFLVDGENVVGVNTSKCATIEIGIEDGKIRDIIQKQSPEGVIDPPELTGQDLIRLKGFSWFDIIRPKKISDIFK
jgi:lipopolysaccharide export system protein LptA